MIKKVFSVLMSLVFLLVISQHAVIIVHFKLNQQSIENKYCINKNKPELKCNGKCYLNKELKESKKSDSKMVITFKNFDLTLNPTSEFIAETPKFIKVKQIVGYKEFLHSEPYLEIFVPPPIASI
ncbi:MAG: hypothetical protein ACTIJ9_13565 [Aequorivita sp.]